MRRTEELAGTEFSPNHGNLSIRGTLHDSAAEAKSRDVPSIAFCGQPMSSLESSLFHFA